MGIDIHYIHPKYDPLTILIFFSSNKIDWVVVCVLSAVDCY